MLPKKNSTKNLNHKRKKMKLKEMKKKSGQKSAVSTSSLSKSAWRIIRDKRRTYFRDRSYIVLNIGSSCASDKVVKTHLGRVHPVFGESPKRTAYFQPSTGTFGYGVVHGEQSFNGSPVAEQSGNFPASFSIRMTQKWIEASDFYKLGIDPDICQLLHLVNVRNLEDLSKQNPYVLHRILLTHSEEINSLLSVPSIDHIISWIDTASRYVE